MKKSLFIWVVVILTSGFMFLAGEAEANSGYDSSADVVVWKDDDGIFHAEKREGIIYSSDQIDHVIQQAMNSLTPGRTHKETVRVVSSGTITRYAAQSPAEALMIPSYTILDIPATLHVEIDENAPGGATLNKRVLVKARNSTHVEIPNINITGETGWAIKMESVSNVRIGHAYLNVGGWSPIRIDHEGSAGRSRDIQIDSMFIVGGNHAFETRGVDRLQIGQVIAKHHTGSAVLLNETDDATIGNIIGYNPEATSNYATFRVTRNDHGRITVNGLVSINAPRGIHIHTGTGDMVVSNIYIDGARDYGIRLSSSPNTVITNGVIKNTRGTAITVYTFDPDLGPDRFADGVSITNMRIYDDRSPGQRTQTHGIVFSGQNGIIANNDLRDAGTVANLAVNSSSTFVRNNLGAGVAQGTVTLQTGSSPAAVVTGVSPHANVSLDLRARAYDAPEASFAWDHHFRYNGRRGEWDLVFDWRTDPGEDLGLEYIVDQPLANLGGSGL